MRSEAIKCKTYSALARTKCLQKSRDVVRVRGLFQISRHDFLGGGSTQEEKILEEARQNGRRVVGGEQHAKPQTKTAVADDTFKFILNQGQPATTSQHESVSLRIYYYNDAHTP